MIEIKNLCKSFGDNQVLCDITETINEGDKVVVIGPSGGGKSTFLRCINCLEDPTSGSIIFEGEDLADMKVDINKHRESIGMVFQQFNLFNNKTVLENITLAPVHLKKMTKEEADKKAHELLKRVGLDDKADAYPSTLSGGQKQRVSIAGVIAMHPKCIILDEPTAMLDPNGRKDVIRAARALNDVEKVTIILITHYMEEVIYANKVYVMDKGKVKLQGTPREVFSHVEELKELRLDVPQVTLLAHELKRQGLQLPDGILTIQELTDALKTCRRAF